MTGWAIMRRVLASGCCVVLSATGCAFDGLNSIPLPGAVGRGPGANIFHVEIANVATLESNSPVMIDDVVIGSVGKMTVKGWHADVEVSVKPDVVVPANAVASIGQTSLLGSMHLQLNPPIGEAPRGRLSPGATIALSQSSTYPTTEQTLSSLSVVVNVGGLGQVGDIIRNFDAALSGHQDQARDLITRLDTFMGTLDVQRDRIVGSIQGLNRLAATLAGQRDVITRALDKIPPALDVLIKQRPRITTALEKLGDFSDTATRLTNDSQADLAKNLQNLGPTIKALADLGPDLDAILGYLTTFPYTQDYIDRAIRGDYVNMFLDLDLTIPRLKRTLFLGTRWGQLNAPLTPAPGDPFYLNYTYDPVGAPVATPPTDAQQPASTPLPVDAPAAAPAEGGSAGSDAAPPQVSAGPPASDTGPSPGQGAPPPSASPPVIPPTNGGG
jgi:phospholipid/cholesterol/gamma-HCH transport system substrate-binding protein